MDTNPYQSPLAEPPESFWSEAMSWLTTRSPDPRIEWLISLAHAIGVVYPLLFVGQIYGCWLLAWSTLGRPPRPSWDDPAEVLGWIYYVAGGLIVPLMPPALITALCSIVLRLARSRSHPVRQVTLALLTLALWVGGFALLRWDPWRVVEWWGD